MSWEQLQETMAENRATARAEAREAPVSCPIDGALLQEGPGGRRNCPMGNYVWPEDTAYP